MADKQTKKRDLGEQVRRVLEKTGSDALNPAEIATALKIKGAAKKHLQRTLNQLVRDGEIVCIRGNRFTIGREADLVAGSLIVLRSGNGLVDGPEGTVFVARGDLGVALPGDRVVARLHPTREGKDNRPAGRIIKIVERTRHDIVGTLRTTGRFLYVVPIDPAYGHDLYVPDAAGASIGDRVLVRFTGWQNRHVNPEGEVIEVIGPSDDPSVDTVMIIRHYGLPDDFPTDVIREAQQASRRMDEPGPRLDLRDRYILTIDPERAKDFDDALSLEVLPDGTRELGVHIADVSHFVQPGSKLDAEARERGNSVYLPDRVIPMLPEQLSNGVCSLRPDEDRLAFSVFLKVNERGNVVGTRFARTLIRSRLRLTYEAAMRALAGKPKQGDTVSGEALDILRGVNKLAHQLRKRRYRAHALELDLPECEIRMGRDGCVSDILLVWNDESHRLIEECMVAANEAVARELSLRKVPYISRLHPPPAPEKIEELTVELEGMGFNPGDLNQAKNLADFLRLIEDHPLAFYVRRAVLRRMSRAVYDAGAVGHFGLAKQYYAHFTSPIRRYPDLIVHRQLAAVLGASAECVGVAASQGGRRRMTKSDELNTVAAHCTRTEEVADEAERALDEIKKYRYIEQQLAAGKPQEYDAVVVTVTNFGMFIEIIELQLQGMVHISAISDRFVRFQAHTQSLKAGKTEYSLGTRLRVKPVRVDFDKRHVDLEVVD